MSSVERTKIWWPYCFLKQLQNLEENQPKNFHNRFSVCVAAKSLIEKFKNYLMQYPSCHSSSKAVEAIFCQILPNSLVEFIVFVLFIYLFFRMWLHFLSHVLKRFIAAVMYQPNNDIKYNIIIKQY